MSKGLPREAHHYPDATWAYGFTAGEKDAKEGVPRKTGMEKRYQYAYDQGYASAKMFKEDS